MMFWYGGGLSSWQVSLMWVGMITFCGLLVWVICSLITAATPAPRTVPVDRDAYSILDAHFARGEINAQHYRRARSLLAGTSGVSLGKEAGL